jgi:hypothetical protein
VDEQEHESPQLERLLLPVAPGEGG